VVIKGVTVIVSVVIVIVVVIVVVVVVVVVGVVVGVVVEGGEDYWLVWNRHISTNIITN